MALSLTSSIRVFIEPFIAVQKDVLFFFKFKTYAYTVCCDSAQTGQAKCDVTNQKSGMNQTTETPEADSQSPCGAIEPRLTAIDFLRKPELSGYLSMCRSLGGKYKVFTVCKIFLVLL